MVKDSSVFFYLLNKFLIFYKLVSFYVMLSKIYLLKLVVLPYKSIFVSFQISISLLSKEIIKREPSIPYIKAARYEILRKMRIKTCSITVHKKSPKIDSKNKDKIQSVKYPKSVLTLPDLLPSRLKDHAAKLCNYETAPNTAEFQDYNIDDELLDPLDQVSEQKMRKFVFSHPAVEDDVYSFSDAASDIGVHDTFIAGDWKKTF